MNSLPTQTFRNHPNDFLDGMHTCFCTHFASAVIDDLYIIYYLYVVFIILHHTCECVCVCLYDVPCTIVCIVLLRW